MIRDQFILDLHEELIIDNFAGGGGASMGIEMALGRPPDIAINHDPEAIAMHKANHPQTLHLCEDVWHVDPVKVCQGRRAGLVHLSPDCTHFSKAKGGKPRDKKIRGLAWLAYKWLAVNPRVLILENVEEFADWGPLLADGTPNRECISQTFNSYIGGLRRRGATDIQIREERACNFGVPTIRKRLYMVARRDGRKVVWPGWTHGAPTSPEVKAGKLKPYRTAAECIDWSIPCPSIFLPTKDARKLGLKRPLADATCRRIAKGIVRFILQNPEPFIVPVTHTGDLRSHPVSEPIRTITSAHRGEFALIAPTLVECAHGEKDKSGKLRFTDGTVDLNRPMPAVVGSNNVAAVTAFLAKHYGGVTGIPMIVPTGTVTAVDHHSLVTSSVIKLRGSDSDHPPGYDMREPHHTVSAQGNHLGEVRAFLTKYYGTGATGQALTGPLHSVTGTDRFGLVIVMIRGEPWAIVDIGFRMLTPRELFNAQGFPGTYIIGDDPSQGLDLTKGDQVRMCGNSVCPPMEEALVRANCSDMSVWEKNESGRQIA